MFIYKMFHYIMQFSGGRIILNKTATLNAIIDLGIWTKTKQTISQCPSCFSNIFHFTRSKNKSLTYKRIMSVKSGIGSADNQIQV